MKKIINFFIVALLLLANTGSFAQSNNPYNQRGIDCYESINIVNNDLNAGRVLELNQETLDYYSSRIPIQTNLRPSVEMGAAIINVVKKANFNLMYFIDTATNLSEFAKSSMKRIWNTKNLSTAQNALITETETIKTAAISNNEKENLLTLVSLTNNLHNYGSAANDFNSIIGGNNNYVKREHIFIGVLVGYILGAPWGPLGQVIGMVVGGVIAAAC